MDFTLRISPDGKDIMMLYSDENPLVSLGGKRVLRASHVRFDEEDQLWYIFERLPDGFEQTWETGFVKRSDAIRHEISVLEEKLEREETAYFQKLFSLER